jgi:hypothetical protein
MIAPSSPVYRTKSVASVGLERLSFAPGNPVRSGLPYRRACRFGWKPSMTILVRAVLGWTRFAADASFRRNFDASRGGRPTAGVEDQAGDIGGCVHSRSYAIWMSRLRGRRKSDVGVERCCRPAPPAGVICHCEPRIRPQGTKFNASRRSAGQMKGHSAIQ